MRKSISALAACLLLSSVVIVGCGGGNDSTTGGGGEIAANAGGGKEDEALGAGGSPGTGKSPAAGESTDGGGASNGGSSGAGESQGGGGGESERATSPAKSAFVAKANALCKKRRLKMQTQVGELLSGAQGEVSQVVVLRQIVKTAVGPGMEGEADELRRLGAPPGDGAKIEAIAAAIEDVAVEARKDPKVFSGRANVFKQAQQASRGYGIGECGRAT